MIKERKKFLFFFSCETLNTFFTNPFIVWGIKCLKIVEKSQNIQFIMKQKSRNKIYVNFLSATIILILEMLKIVIAPVSLMTEFVAFLFHVIVNLWILGCWSDKQVIYKHRLGLWDVL